MAASHASRQEVTAFLTNGTANGQLAARLFDVSPFVALIAEGRVTGWIEGARNRTLHRVRRTHIRKPQTPAVGGCWRTSFRMGSLLCLHVVVRTAARTRLKSLPPLWQSFVCGSDAGERGTTGRRRCRRGAGE